MTLTPKNYTLKDYITIPFKISRQHVIGVVLLKILMSLVPVLLLLSTSNFIDTVVANAQTAIIIQSFSLLLGVILLNWVLNAMYDRLKIKLNLAMYENINLSIVEHIASLKYFYIENNDNWELVERVNNKPADRFLLSFFNILDLTQYAIETISLLLVIAYANVPVAIIIGALIVPFCLISLKSGEEEYEAYEDASVYFRRAKYFSSILSTREYLEERKIFNFSGYINNKWSQNFSEAVAIEKQANKKMFMRVTLGYKTVIANL